MRVQRLSRGSSSGSPLLFQGYELPRCPQKIYISSRSVTEVKALLLKSCTVFPQGEEFANPERLCQRHHQQTPSQVRAAAPSAERRDSGGATEVFQLLLQPQVPHLLSPAVSSSFRLQSPLST